MADSGHEVPPIPVPPVEPKPRASRAKKKPEESTEATVIPPIVDLAGGSTLPSAPPVSEAAPSQPNPYVQPNPYAQPAVYTQPNPYAAPGQPPAYGSAPPAYAPQQQYYGVEQSKTLSIVSMILGIAGVIFLGPLGGIPAVITGHMAQKRQPYAKGFWLTGIITGYLAIAWGVLVLLLFIGIFAASMSDYSSYGY